MGRPKGKCKIKGCEDYYLHGYCKKHLKEKLEKERRKKELEKERKARLKKKEAEVAKKHIPKVAKKMSRFTLVEIYSVLKKKRIVKLLDLTYLVKILSKLEIDGLIEFDTSTADYKYIKGA